MQSALIWFNKGKHPLSLPRLKTLLRDELGCSVEDTEWRLDAFVVPQLRVAAPARFLLQIEDAPHVAEEAEEFAEDYGQILSPGARIAWASCDARVAVGDECDTPVTVTTDSGIFAFVGRTTFDPSDPVVNPLLKSIASRVDGFLWDNVNATVWWGP